MDACVSSLMHLRIDIVLCIYVRIYTLTRASNINNTYRHTHTIVHKVPTPYNNAYNSTYHVCERKRLYIYIRYIERLMSTVNGLQGLMDLRVKSGYVGFDVNIKKENFSRNVLALSLRHVKRKSSINSILHSERRYCEARNISVRTCCFWMCFFIF